MKKIILTIAFVAVSQITFAQDAFKADVVKFLKISGASAPIEKVTAPLVDNVPDAKKAEFKKELDLSINDFLDKMAEMYMTEFSHNDIKEMLKFYQTPVGKKIADKSGVLFDKGQVVGQEWGMGLQSTMMKYMQE